MFQIVVVDLIFSFGSEVARSILCPFGVPIQCVPLSLAFVAMLFSFSGSWHCSYFNGADISFTGSHFGLWTLEDIEGKCQRWDVLFFSYKLGAPLAAARVFSMACMLIGLSLVTAMAQALQFHIVRYVLDLKWSIGRYSSGTLTILDTVTESACSFWGYSCSVYQPLGEYIKLACSISISHIPFTSTASLMCGSSSSCL